jgi:hypothetical protein
MEMCALVSYEYYFTEVYITYMYILNFKMIFKNEMNTIYTCIYCYLIMTFTNN